jgi:hypothetical protein
MQLTQKTFNHGDDVTFPNVVSEPLYFGKRTPTHFEGWRALVDQEDGEVISIVSEAYRMVRHENIINATEDALQKAGFQFDRKLTLIKEGAKMVAEYTLPDIEVVVAPNDIIHPTLIIKNSYDLSWVASILGGIYRLVCANGAYVGTMFEKFKHRHVGQLNAETMMSRVSGVTASFERFETFYKDQAALPLTDFMTEKVAGFLPLNKGEQVALMGMRERSSGLALDLVPKKVDGEDTAVWAIRGGENEKHSAINLFNLLTEFNTHRVTSATRRDFLSDKIARAMMN